MYKSTRFVSIVRSYCYIYTCKPLSVFVSMNSTENYYKFLESEKFLEVASFNEEEVESCHNFIQWTFPTTTPSQFNGDCPVINVQELRKNEKFPTAQEKIKIMLKIMKSHWGLNDDGSVNLSKIRRLNGHNGLRFSRVIQSLVYHDLVPEAKEMLNQVLKVTDAYVRPSKQGDRTIWEIRLEQAIAECV